MDLMANNDEGKFIPFNKMDTLQLELLLNTADERLRELVFETQQQQLMVDRLKKELNSRKDEDDETLTQETLQ